MWLGGVSLYISIDLPFYHFFALLQPYIEAHETLKELKEIYCRGRVSLSIARHQNLVVRTKTSKSYQRYRPAVDHRLFPPVNPSCGVRTVQQQCRPGIVNSRDLLLYLQSPDNLRCAPLFTTGDFYQKKSPQSCAASMSI